MTGSGLHRYKAGDSLGVFPSNRPEEVDAILAALGARGTEPVMLPKATEAVTLREALSGKLALAGPTRRIVETLASKASDPGEKAQNGRTAGARVKAAPATWWLPRTGIHRPFWSEFPSARILPQELVDHMRKLMPRLYSIASSPKVHPHEIHLTVAITLATRPTGATGWACARPSSRTA